MTDEHPSEQPPRSGQRLPRPKSPCVLLIEDDEVMREMLAEALRRGGCQVTECADPVRWLLSCIGQAWGPPASEAHSQHYDVVVSDIRMPNLSGLDALRILKQLRCTDTCPPTILITAFGDPATHQTARELGAVAVLDKPFATRDLLEAVRAAVGT